VRLPSSGGIEPVRKFVEMALRETVNERKKTKISQIQSGEAILSGHHLQPSEATKLRRKGASKLIKGEMPIKRGTMIGGRNQLKVQ